MSYGSEYGQHGYVDFARLWGLLEKRGLKRQFLVDNGFHKSTIYRLVRNGNVDCRTIAQLCNLLKVQPNAIMEYCPDEGIATGQTVRKWTRSGDYSKGGEK